ncbi:protein of unknown function [Cnuella takakiae]|uniref:Uncharacterized protein n=1 Tax=Cnuella takakiae TaxID=1302690 RepID=A0A1M5HVI4_9BACT|nr:DUF4134 domain-containing protein [Cnuella takakiae]OLY95691.1 hypothetical protein BUE76_00275 [Cnuella takakiae]SHG19978.1 protein of unknown function [Cnuella takakiae]
MKQNNRMKAAMLTALTLYSTTALFAQNLGTGIDQASSQVKGVFTNVSTLILMIGGIVGLVGAIRVYVKWQNGDQDVQKSIVGWMGACVFLLLTGTILKTIFGM